MAKVAVLGMGAMGSRVARNLIKAKHDVTVYNRSPEPALDLLAEGARIADSPREAASGSDVVMSFVTDDAASEAVWMTPGIGALDGLGPDAIAIESSTVTPDWVRRLAQAVQHKTQTFLDAPVVGSRPQAEAAGLVYLVGGSTESYERAREVLSASAATIVRVGEIGAGSVMKLAVNSIFACQVAALAESLHYLVKSGIAEDESLRILGSLPITSPALQGIGKQISARAFAPMFPVALVYKDLRYIAQAAKAVEAAVPCATAASLVFGRGVEQGIGDANIAGIYQLYDKD